MPELPEVETVRTALQEAIVDKTIAKVDVFREKIVKNFTPSQLVGRRVLAVERRGKYLLVRLSGDVTLLSHLRMEGKYFIAPAGYEKQKHDHVFFTMTDGTTLVYNDTRVFGTMHLYSDSDIEAAPQLLRVGVDPLSPKFSAAFLKKGLKRKRKSVKTALLEQDVVSGIGNIYADEILFAAKVAPTALASELSDGQIAAIARASRRILKLAVKHRGSTIRSYHFDGKTSGSFQNLLKVHTKAGKPCPRCRTTIVKTKIGGRGTYYCPQCQK